MLTYLADFITHVLSRHRFVAGITGKKEMDDGQTVNKADFAKYSVVCSNAWHGMAVLGERPVNISDCEERHPSASSGSRVRLIDTAASGHHNGCSMHRAAACERWARGRA